jgi:hypothetical protein
MENIWATSIAISMTQTPYRTPTEGTEANTALTVSITLMDSMAANIVTNHQIIRMRHKAPKLLAQIIDTKGYCCGSRRVRT